MGWSYRPKGRSCQCNGEFVRYCRRSRGWTQEDLARAAGYSVRVIAKAEASGSIHPDTIEDIAHVLSTPEVTVHPEDLSSSPESVVLRLLSVCARHEQQVVANAKSFLAEDMSAFVPGDSSILSFCGKWETIDGFNCLWRHFIRFIERSDTTLAHKPKHLVVQGNEAMALIFAKTSDAPSVPVTLYFRFNRGRIAHFGAYFDHIRAAESYRKLLAQQDGDT